MRHCWLRRVVSQRWTVGTSHYWVGAAEPHQSVRFPRLWMLVDKWITWGLFEAGDEGVEDAPGQKRSLGDEGAEVRTGVRAGFQRLTGGFRAVDAAGGGGVPRRSGADGRSPALAARRGAMLARADPNRARSVRTFASVAARSAGPESPPARWES